MGNEEIRNQAYEDYKQGLKYKEIAEKYSVSLSAVKSWAARYWKKDSCNLKEKKLRPEKKRGATCETKPEDRKEFIAEEVIQVIENPDLTDKQRLFCLYYVRCFNATKSHQKAYDSKYETAMVEGCHLLRNPNVRDEIQRLKQNRLNREMLSEEDIFQKYIDIAFADMRDQADVKGGTVMLKPEFDGTIVSEISNTQSGIKVKLNDRMKALQWLAEHMDILTEEQKVRIKVMLSKEELGEKDDWAEDGFMEALSGTAAEDWKDAENSEV